MFSPIACQFLPRENDEGWDISAIQAVARKVKCDMLVCLGESCYFWKPDWLKPMVEAWKRYGAGMYGFFSSFLVRPHMNTTGFCCDPRFLLGYPQVTDHVGRYSFEHGLNSFWKRMQMFGKPAKLVTADGVYDPPQWRSAPNIMWRGDQSNCLIRCNHLDRWDAADEETKKNWSAGADGVKQ